MKNSEKLIPMKYTGEVPCEIRGLGKFNPGESREIPEKFARNLQHDRNWKKLEPKIKKDSAADTKLPGTEKGKGGK